VSSSIARKPGGSAWRHSCAPSQLQHPSLSLHGLQIWRPLQQVRPGPWNTLAAADRTYDVLMQAQPMALCIRWYNRQPGHGRRGLTFLAPETPGSSRQGIGCAGTGLNAGHLCSIVRQAAPDMACGPPGSSRHGTWCAGACLAMRLIQVSHSAWLLPHPRIGCLGMGTHSRLLHAHWEQLREQLREAACTACVDQQQLHCMHWHQP
jgi:hypothetical protein